jgi:hypothetical protein
MSNSTERHSDIGRRQASELLQFLILDAQGTCIKIDRRAGCDRRGDPTTTLQLIKVNDFLASLADIIN